MPQEVEKLGRVAVTGASGTLVYHILTNLLGRSGAGILALHRAQSKFAPIPGIQYQTVDFSDFGQLSDALEKFRPDVIIHCAAAGTSLPRSEWFDLIRFNIEASLNLCELASKQAPCHFIYISTALAYCGKDAPLVETDALDSLHPYGASKAAAEMLLRSAGTEFGVPLTVVRPFSFTGVGDHRTRLFPSLLRAAATGESMNLTSCRQIRDHCSARDIAAGIIAAMFHPPMARNAHVYNLGSGNTITLRDLLERLVDELKLPVTLRFGTRAPNPVDPLYLVADITRARDKLAWKPVHNLAHAVWQLAQASFPELKLKEPKEFL